MTLRAALLLLAAGATAVHGDVGPAGGEFQVNTFTTGFQGNARVSVDGGGAFVVVWESGYGGYFATQDGSGAGVIGRRFDASGASASAEFIVNTFRLGPQRAPAIASDATGNFVVAWESGSPSYYYGSHPDGSASGVFLQRYDPMGGALGGETLVNTTTQGRQGVPAVASDPAGNFVVVWQSGGYRVSGDGSSTGIFGQRFDPTGIPLGPEFQVNTYTTGPQLSPAIASDAAGDFVVVWQSGTYGLGQDGSGAGIFARRFDPSGAPLGDEFQVNTYTTGAQATPAVASDADGHFVVVWQSGYYGAGGDGSGPGVFGQRFDVTGLPAGPEFQVNTYTTGTQRIPTVASDAAGNFVVTWQSGYYGSGQDGSGAGVFGQHFTATGVPNGPEFQVNTFTTGPQIEPQVAASPAGDFVVAWSSSGYPPQDGSGSGIFAQRLRTTAFAPPDLVAGSRLAMRDDPADARRKALTARADDAAIDLGAGAGSLDDPTLTGGHVRVRSGQFDDTYDLPAAGWSASGTGPARSYRYQDNALVAGPIQAARVRVGRFKVKGRGAQLGHSLARDPDPVTIVLQLGDRGQRYCAEFGGTIQYKPDAVYRSRKARVPSSCPR
jgi:hypothetical protein